MCSVVLLVWHPWIHCLTKTPLVWYGSVRLMYFKLAYCGVMSA